MTNHYRMKVLYFFLKVNFLFFCLPIILGAQETKKTPMNIFLFDRFTNGKILLTDERCIVTQFNYNCQTQELYFKAANKYQMMHNTSNVDTLYIQDRKFVPAHEGCRFLECISVGEETLLVDWKVRFYYKGKRSAMGVVSQAGGQASVDMEWMLNKGLSNPDNSVYKREIQNTYWIILNGQQVSFSNLKSFLKLYPDTHRKAIRQLAKNQSINFDDPWQVAKLIIICQNF